MNNESHKSQSLRQETTANLSLALEIPHSFPSFAFPEFYSVFHHPIPLTPPLPLRQYDVSFQPPLATRK